MMLKKQMICALGLLAFATVVWSQDSTNQGTASQDSSTPQTSAPPAASGNHEIEPASASAATVARAAPRRSA